MNLLGPPYSIFTITGGVILVFCLIEIFLFLFGATISKIFHSDVSIDKDFELDIDADIETDISGNISVPGVSVFHMGEVPFVVVLLCFGTFFTISGLSAHFVADKIGIPLSNLIAIPGSIFASSALSFFATRFFSKIIPNNESYAVKLDDLLGEKGKVVIGKGDYNNFVQIVVHDKNGSPHYIMTKSAIEGQELNQGEEVVLIEKYKNGSFGSILKLKENSKEVELEMS